MRSIFKGSFRVIVAVFCAAFAQNLPAQNFRAFTELSVIRTDHFDIIFPEESRPTAERLASFADGMYERTSDALDIRVRGRIPVAITPHTQEFNGYMNPFPYPHIVLFDTPMDIEWTTFSDSLEGLFLHELTHAVSLSSRGPFLDFLHRVFGGWVLPTGLTTPYFMVEGVTVSFESRSGFGRANDPLVKQRVRQAVRDNALLDPFQASGVYDRPPFGSASYEYGGLFSAFIQERWGMEKYAELWKRLGSRFPLSLDFYNHGFYRIFRDVYGVDARTAWADFAASLAVTGLEDPAAPVLPPAEALYESVAAGGGKVYYLDLVSRRVVEHDPATGSSRTAADVDSSAYDIDVSSDGSTILVSGYRYEGAVATAVVREHDAATGRRTGRSWEGLYRARYFRDGVLALGSERHANRIVFVDGRGKREVLLTGDARLLFSSPAPVDAYRFAFVAAEGGVRSVGLYDLRSGEASRVATDLADDGDRWRYVRGLRASGGRLYFSYVHDDRFYKLASIDPATGEARFSGRDFSGGVFDAVEAGGALFYRGRFSDWDRALRYPLDAASFAAGADGRTTVAALHLELWDLSAAGAGEASDSTLGAAEAAESRPYHALPYLNPFKMWVPFPLVRSDGSETRWDGGGIVSYLSDPTDANTALVQAAWNGTDSLAEASVSWNTFLFGVPATLTGSDGMEFGSSLDDASRATRFGAALSFQRGIRGERTQLILSPSFAGALLADDPDDGSSAYEWKYGEGDYWAGFSATLSSMYLPSWRLFGSGAAATVQARAALPDREVRADGTFRAAFEPALPLRVLAYGVYDQSGTTVDGYSDAFGSPVGAAAFEGMTEYRSEAGEDHEWVAGGQAELRLFSIESQTNLSHLYFSRLFGTVAWRGAAYGGGSVGSGPGAALGGDARWLQSAVLKVGAVVTALPAAMVPLRYSPHFWFAWKISDAENDDGKDDFAFGVVAQIEW